MIIRNPTVFVLGAGASNAYGFPLGKELISKVVSTLGTTTGNSDYEALRLASGCGDEQIARFREDLRDCARASIDAFLMSPNGEQYDLLGRCAIVQQLMKCESEEALRTPDEKLDWCGYLLEQILGSSQKGFLRNQLKIITFNFDRSFECRLFMALRASHGIDVAVELWRYFEVVHIHGQLGHLLIPDPRASGGGARAYAVGGSDFRDILACANQIKIVHQTAADEAIQRARTILKQAARVYFLGFSYHPLNLAKLDVPRTIAEKGTGNILGTRFNMPEGAIRGMPADIHTQMEFAKPDQDIMAVLRDRAEIYDWDPQG